jgi:predicted nucleic acid-binding protein
LTRAAGKARNVPLFIAEPPAIYAVRPPLVVDCSVLSAVLFQEPMRDDALRQAGGRTLHAPTLLDHELANVAIKKRRHGWPADSVDLALSNYVQLEIALHRVDIAAQVALAQRYGLSAYDAAYLWLAAELKAPLATFDQKLGTAVQQHFGTLE